MTRLEDWPRRLDEYLAAARERPFEWGTHDCALFACDAIEAMTGVDPAAPFRGKYETARGAYGALKRFAGGGLEETAEKITRELGMGEVPVLFAQRGDVVLLSVEGPDGGVVDALGVVAPNGRHAAVAGVEGGWALRPLGGAKRAWRVG